jgi:DNA polymerase (family 10)
MPGQLSELMRISGLGPQRIATIHKALNVTTLDELKKAAQDGRIQEIKGFGEKTQQSILEEIDRLGRQSQQRTPLAVVEQYAKPLIDYLRRAPDFKDIVIAGSYRRRRDTVGDLDILVTCKKSATVIERLATYDEADKVLSKGKTQSTVRLQCGLQVDLRVLPQVSYGSALLYFTGSKQHNIAVRKIAVYWVRP